MSLKYKLTSKNEIPAELAAHYIERDGAWFLDAEGAADKAKLDEFRNANIALVQQLDEQTKRFHGIDPDEVHRLAEEKRKLEEQQQLKAGEVEKVIETRVKAAKTDFEKQLGAITSERDALNGRLVTIQIDQGVVAAATKRGLRPTAIPDITARARNIFKLVNGVPTAFEADGQTVRVGKDGVKPMAIEEWLEAQLSEAPHLFESNAGGGAASNSSGGSGNRSVKNPFRRDSWNLTEQMRLQRNDPNRAQQLKASAATN
ncbi:MAG: hypothetical protein JWO95_79 [Verrucomicrobiales bacterium]|nr:hypothetical protein [Verrucomicrobiales bacterium]